MGGLVFGAQGVTPTLRGQPTNVYALPACSTMLIPPGNWGCRPGRYSNVEQYDPITTTWRACGGAYPDATHIKVESDGVNWRFANRTGGMVGALVFQGGSSYTSNPTCTASAGASVWQTIVGGAVGQTITVTNGGSNYVYAPQVQFSAPGSPGVQATGFATISNGAVSTITVVDQGAGYTSAPTITLVNDPRDTTGYGASATCVLTGSGTVTAVLCLDPGNATTSLPTLTISGGGGSGAVAVAIGLYTITAYTVSAAGSGYSGTIEISGLGGFTASAQTYSNPTIQANLVRTRKASILGALSGTTLTTVGQSVYDGGIYPGVPSPIVYGDVTGTGTFTNAVVGLTVGGANDVVEMFPA